MESLLKHCVSSTRDRDDPELAETTTRQILPLPTCATGRNSQAQGGVRPLGIATVEDRVVQTAMKLVLNQSSKLTTTAPMAIGPSGMPKWLP